MLYLELIAGLALLILGGDLLVRGAVATARRIGVSPLLIGLTLVGFGTSTPELVASVEAALLGSPGIALGNVVGSNIANSCLILGVGAAIAPIRAARAAFMRDGPVLLGASLAMVAACQLAVIGRGIGIAFLLLLLGYVLWTYRTEKGTGRSTAAMPASEAEAGAAISLAKGLVLALGGLGSVLLGATLLVDGAIALARLWGISEAAIGVTLVALGTSLPELATTLAAARRGQTDVAFGNVVGSNIFNILGIAGAAALARPLAVPPEVAHFHVWIMLASTLVLILFTVTRWQISRAEGTLLLAAYLAYLTASLY
jgi:cation:H+ antiporter